MTALQYNFLYELIDNRDQSAPGGYNELIDDSDQDASETCAKSVTGNSRKKDSELAVKVARSYLGSNTLFSDETLQKAARTLSDLIHRQTFYIREQVWDAKRVAKLETNDPEQWAKGLLEVIYAIRCNTFHGQKGFAEQQRDILYPCISVLERLNELLLNKLNS
jgi:hypothetical protein